MSAHSLLHFAGACIYQIIQQKQCVNGINLLLRHYESAGPPLRSMNRSANLVNNRVTNALFWSGRP